jgi:hypothetical protein
VKAARASVGFAISAAGSLLFAAAASADVIVPSADPPSAVEGQLFTGDLGTFIDTPAAGDTASDYAVTIDWGDGSAATPGTTAGSIQAGWTVSGLTGHTYAEEGTYTITVSIDDMNDATSATLLERAKVDDAPLSVAAGMPQQFSGTGAAGAATGRAAFAAAIGGADNGTEPGERAGGYRQINWDDVKLDGTDNGGGSPVISAGKVVVIPANRMTARGIGLGGPGAVAGDGFASVNSGVADDFPAFSQSNVFAPLNTKELELDIDAPGSIPTEAQATRGLGIVLLNVRDPGTTVTFFNGSAQLLRVPVPVGAQGAPTFVGALFGAPVITRVAVTLGSAQIFQYDGSAVTSGPADGGGTNLVAVDDVVLAEPAPSDPNLTAVAGVQLSGVVSRFTDTDPNGTASDYTANIEWGDGSRSQGTVANGASGGFTLSGQHTYAGAGSHIVIASVTDLGGASHTTRFTVTVAARPTATAVSCSPASVVVGRPTTCTATVSDTLAAVASAPTGTVAVAGAQCKLARTTAVGHAACRVTYVPTRLGSGQQAISAVYSGDDVYATSTGTMTLKIRKAGCSMRAGREKLAPPAPRLRLTVNCDEPANVRVGGIAVVAAKGGRRGLQVSVGSVSARLKSGHATKLSIRPPAAAVAVLRAATRRGQAITLRLSLSGTLGTSTKTRAKATSGKVVVAGG